MPYFILAICLGIAAVLGGRALLTTNPRVLARVLRLTTAAVLGFFALFFLLVERVAVAAPLLALALLLLGRPPRGGLAGWASLLGGLFGGGPWSGTRPASGPGPGPVPGSAAPGGAGQGHSEVRTAWLAVRLDLASGDMSGKVLQGDFAGRQLGDLDLRQLLMLLADCRNDDERSALLLESFLDRRFGDRWRKVAAEEQARAEADARASAGNAGGSGRGGGGAGGRGAMSREEAFEILGLSPGAPAEAVREAHRKLMKKLHPDHGGSSYLASKINEARDILLRG